MIMIWKKEMEITQEQGHYRITLNDFQNYCLKDSSSNRYVESNNKMPIDHRRIAGPENTVPYRLFTKLNTKSFNDSFSQAVNNKNGLRLDGRKIDEPRKIFVKCGIVSRAKGSAYIEVEKTKVIISVYDPREIPKKTDYSSKGELYCEFKYAPFSCPKRRLYQQDAEEKQNSAILKRALESAVCRHEFPNFQVDVYVVVLENDGSALSAAITGAGLALAHAGIPMYDIITSATLGIQGNIKLLDPTLLEEALCDVAVPDNQTNTEQNYSSHGIIVLSMLSTQQQISEFYQTGNLGMENLHEGVDILTKATKEIVPLIEKCLVGNVAKSIKHDVED